MSVCYLCYRLVLVMPVTPLPLLPLPAGLVVVVVVVVPVVLLFPVDNSSGQQETTQRLHRERLYKSQNKYTGLKGREYTILFS